MAWASESAAASARYPRFRRRRAARSSNVLASQIVQVNTDARAKPSIPAFTIMSADRNMPNGVKSRGSSAEVAPAGGDNGAAVSAPIVSRPTAVASGHLGRASSSRHWSARSLAGRDVACRCLGLRALQQGQASRVKERAAALVDQAPRGWPREPRSQTAVRQHPRRQRSHPAQPALEKPRRGYVLPS
jgi:hypothetical protein